MEGFFKARKSRAWIEQAMQEEARRHAADEEGKGGGGIAGLFWALSGAGLLMLLFQRPPVPPA